MANAVRHRQPGSPHTSSSLGYFNAVQALRRIIIGNNEEGRRVAAEMIQTSALLQRSHELPSHMATMNSKLGAEHLAVVACWCLALRLPVCIYVNNTPFLAKRRPSDLPPFAIFRSLLTKCSCYLRLFCRKQLFALSHSEGSMRYYHRSFATGEL